MASVESKLKGGIFLLAAVTLIGVAMAMFVGRVGFLRTASRSAGVVSKLNAGGSHPQIDFDFDGVRYSYPQGGMTSSYKVGDLVTVLYDRDNPRMTAVIDTFGVLWLGHILLAVMGSVFLASALRFFRSNDDAA
ncbi:MAG: DUF3592 domain-containing protein [Clostridia bacterium]|nr:DUF3592 domain-containing protein [Deltaproteobacteria bacterium]